MTKDLTPDLEAYRVAKLEGKDVYRVAHSATFADPDHRPSQTAVQRLVKDVEKQQAKRGQFSRRRAVKEEDVTYINERNMRFNKKISRAYDEYTKEIKQNFERGTAL